MSVDFPAPVAPTMPTRSPGRTSNDTSRRTQSLAVVGERDVVEDDVASMRRSGVRASDSLPAIGSGSGIRSRRRVGPASRIRDRATRIVTGVSSSLKIRSEEAIAACRMLNFSDMSLIGRKKRCEYSRNATSDPSVSVPCSVQPPPNQMISADASAPIDLDRRIEHGVVEDRVDVRVAVLRG